MSEEPQAQQTTEGQVEKIGDFEIFKDHLLGKGAWGEVYRGRQVSLERPVAVKILKKELSADEEFVRRFMREAKCIAQLIDENIIQVYGAGVHEGAYYFAMEFVQGLPLQKFLDRGRKFSTDDIIYIGRAVAKALKAAWESPEQVVHRDIKPSNIMVSFSSSLIASSRKPDTNDSIAFVDVNINEAKIKVMDFGLAKVASSSAGKDATMVGTIIGTPKYISPEQGLGNPADIRSDIYSLGIVMYEAVAGRIPFDSDSAIELIRSHIYAEPPPPSLFNDRIPGNLEKVILKGIKKNPADLKSMQQASDLQARPMAEPPGRRETDPQGYPVDGSPPARMPEIANTSNTIMKIMPERKKKYWPFAFIPLTVIIIVIIAFFTLTGKINRLAAPPDQASPAVKVDKLISQARLAIELKDFNRAKDLMMQAAGQNHDSEELRKLVQEFNGNQVCKVQDNLAPTIRNMLKHAQLELADNNFDKVRFILSEAYFLDPCSPEIDVVFHEMETKKKSIENTSVNSDSAKKIESLIQEGMSFLRQKNIVDAEHKLSEARYLALQDPDNNKELGNAINGLLENIKKETSGK